MDMLCVTDGPEDIVILGEDTAEVGSAVMLYCSAASVPPAAIHWTVNGTQTDVNTGVYVIEKSNCTDSGNYTCIATNDITGYNVFAVHMLIVKAEAPSIPAFLLTPGEAAGVTIGVIAGVAILALALYFGVRHLRNSSKVIGQQTARNNSKTGWTQRQRQEGSGGTSHYSMNIEPSRNNQSTSSDHRTTTEPAQNPNNTVYESINDKHMSPTPKKRLPGMAPRPPPRQNTETPDAAIPTYVDFTDAASTYNTKIEVSNINHS
ncbi:hypothetical protein AAFF_G00418710 [Aldrovandia affinis]|uniref:Ig-like domain-containing protein n=1 Tax=Aldrovandia affinis TaxID=143900 RepID=A0AAD7R380_9TELE|nr:hypothetical protein AAFF_G00418710 [Aldrovandia affinis]